MCVYPCNRYLSITPVNSAVKREDVCLKLRYKPAAMTARKLNQAQQQQRPRAVFARACLKA